MKNLYSKLHSLVDLQNSKEATMSLPDQLCNATNHIKKMQTKLERMKEKKEGLLLGLEKPNVRVNEVKKVPVKNPEIEVHENGSGVEVVLITGLGREYRYFSEIIQILQEEGSEVLHAKFFIAGDTVFYTFHAEIGYPEDFESTGAASRISEKFQKFVNKNAHR